MSEYTVEQMREIARIAVHYGWARNAADALDYAAARIEELETALKPMVERFGLCFKRLRDPFHAQILTAEDIYYRCGECPACKARAALEKLGVKQHE